MEQKTIQECPRVTFADLGFCIAKLTIGDGIKSWKDSLVILSPECADEHTVSPAASITIQGKNSMKALQDLLNKAFPIE